MLSWETPLDSDDSAMISQTARGANQSMREGETCCTLRLVQLISYCEQGLRMIISFTVPNSSEQTSFLKLFVLHHFEGHQQRLLTRSTC